MSGEGSSLFDPPWSCLIKRVSSGRGIGQVGEVEMRRLQRLE
jgi:hypothetical protein